jgi:hypothetical protein
MSQLRAILIRETEKARLFKVADREVWIPRSVVKTITKFAPDAKGHRECILDCEDWFAAKENL